MELADGVRLDILRKKLQIGSELLNLTRLEWAVIEYLASEPGRVHTVDAIGARVWGPTGADVGAVKAVIKRIRGKLGSAGASPDLISNHRGFGYSVEIEDLNNNAA